MDKNLTPMELAASLLKTIQKSESTAVQYDQVPRELCWGEDINLDHWTMVLNDNNLVEMSKMPEEAYVPDSSCKGVPEMFDRFWDLSLMKHGLVSLSMKDAKGITDYGLSVLIRKSPSLKHLDITGCVTIGDVCMRELGMHCPHLQSLILTSCHSIVGDGIVAVGECCKQIRKISISRMKRLEKFAVNKLFLSCPRLEEIDVSHYVNIGDDEIRLLAANCPNLMVFNAKDSHFLSDQSILAISKGCPEIDKIDMSRQNYAYKISDVSLLSLGQRSFSLRSLVLNGCDHLSDVGINWLAEGCKAVENLELCGCTKLTDAALRSIGTNCHSLVELDVCGAALVSDVGITQIASGCPDIKTFKCHGMFYLSDPRIAAPKKGDKLEAWQSVVGMAAVAEFAKYLENVDFSGCFRLNVALHRYLSRMQYLKKLNLMGCNQSTAEGLAAVAKGCRLLEEINLSDCGKSVCGLSMEAFGTYCNNIRSMTLARCTSLDGKAIAGIAKCEKLEKLDVSACTSLNDLRFLPISEIDKVVNLRHLIIVNIPRLTDATISWIANGCSNILILAFKGTSITKPAAKAVRDKFPFCDMVFNDNFCGYWPKPRIDDRRLMNRYFVMEKGIVAIQARARKLMAHKRIAHYLHDRKRALAAWLVLSCIRIVIAKKRIRIVRWKKGHRNRAAVKLTSMFWVAKAKARVKWRISVKIIEWKAEQAMMIQRVYRSHFVWVRQLRWAREYFRWLRERFKAAQKIQSIVRMQYKGIKVAKKKYAMIIATRELHERKAAFIQRCYRGHKVRQHVQVIRERREHARQHYTGAVSCVQRNWRCHRTHEIVKAGEKRRLKYRKAVVNIQRMIRGCLNRLLVAEIKADIMEQRQDEAARKIQAAWKIKMSRLDLEELERGLRLLEEKKWNAQIVFAKTYRRKLAYRVYAKLKKEKLDSIHRRIDAFIISATKIQSLYRGSKGRVRYMELLKEKRGKWKELFDEEKQRRFFYSKITGEIRWRMPRDLLELIPRPGCDNCNFYEAAIECAVCNEMFCAQCWNQVHYGGRRKDHEWRSLYDFYGKRLDYGDGVFPCKWPSEVVQDEIQGWMLRVAPIRDPNCRYGDWEEYQDVEGKIEGNQLLQHRGNKGVSSGESRLFYFNRRTFEATYEVPEEVTLIAQEASYALDNSQQFTHSFEDSGYHSQSGHYDQNGTWVQRGFSEEVEYDGNYEDEEEFGLDDPETTALEQHNLQMSYSPLDSTPRVTGRRDSSAIYKDQSKRILKKRKEKMLEHAATYERKKRLAQARAAEQAAADGNGNGGASRPETGEGMKRGRS